MKKGRRGRGRRMKDESEENGGEMKKDEGKKKTVEK